MSTDHLAVRSGSPTRNTTRLRTARDQKILNITWRRPKRPTRETERDQSGTWLRSAVIGLGVLAAAAAAVSFAAQYQLLFAAKGIRWASVLEAGSIPDVGATVFAALGRRPGPEGQAGTTGPRRQPRRDRPVPGDEPDRSRRWLARRRHLGHAVRGLRVRLGHSDRCHPRPRPRLPGPGRQREDRAQRCRHGPAMDAAARTRGPVHAQGLPRLGRGLLPGRPRRSLRPRSPRRTSRRRRRSRLRTLPPGRKSLRRHRPGTRRSAGRRTPRARPPRPSGRRPRFRPNCSGLGRTSLSWPARCSARKTSVPAWWPVCLRNCRPRWPGPACRGGRQCPGR